MLRPQDKQSNLHMGEPPASKKGMSIRQTGNGLDKDRLSETEMRMSWPCNFKAAKDSGHLYFEGFTLCIFCGKLQKREKKKKYKAPVINTDQKYQQWKSPIAIHVVTALKVSALQAAEIFVPRF